MRKRILLVPFVALLMFATACGSSSNNSNSSSSGGGGGALANTGKVTLLSAESPQRPTPTRRSSTT